MSETLAVDVDPGAGNTSHGAAAAVFMAVFFLAGVFLFVKALRLLRKKHSPHHRYTLPRH